MSDALNVASTFTLSYMWNWIFLLAMDSRQRRKLSLSTERACCSVGSSSGSASHAADVGMEVRQRAMKRADVGSNPRLLGSGPFGRRITVTGVAIKTFVGIKYDLREAASCENRLHPGAGLSCCAGRAFNPEEATCCKVEDGNSMAAVTEGLSEKVSHCCGLKAYNRLNEICCQSAVRVKPAPVAGCCGKEAFDVDTQLCCGPVDNKRILTRGSREHLCCGHHQFDPWTHCCCSMSGGLKIQPIRSRCCLEEADPCKSSP
ncbi:Galaxin [Liparis tanakae]|uniref:Galaxin n=1 Tax=Liparis tanakae TaxID=230148 RepID=A0A4Z2GNU1_9TELE|nr:Galaxin [Liparis tanakae]